MSDRKKELLGMSPSTASSRLIKDLLWNFIQQSDLKICYRCGEEMTRETFSVEHKESWILSSTPLDTYFDLTNIAYSHGICNSLDGLKNAQKSSIKYTPEEAKQKKLERSRKWKENNRVYNSEERKERYRRLGS